MRTYIIYIDENLPRQLAKGLNELQQPQNARDELDLKVLSIKDIYGEGEKDEDWIPKVGEKKRHCYYPRFQNSNSKASERVI